MATILAVRHGQTPWNRERRVQGWAPVGLTDRGAEDARRLGRHLASVAEPDRILTSDLRRALATTRRIRRALPAPPESQQRTAWRERDFGELQGLSYDELFEGFPEFAVLDVGYPAATARPRGGERWVDARARVLHATDRLVADLGPGETAFVVSHGGPIRHLLAAVEGLDVAGEILELSVPNCSVTELRIDGSVSIPPEPTPGLDTRSPPEESGDADVRDPDDPAATYEPAFADVASVVREADAAFLPDVDESA